MWRNLKVPSNNPFLQSSSRLSTCSSEVVGLWRGDDTRNTAKCKEGFELGSESREGEGEFSRQGSNVSGRLDCALNERGHVQF